MIKTKKIIIFGVGGYCANLIDIMNDINIAKGEEVYKPVGFLDDDVNKHGSEYCGLPVLGFCKDAINYETELFVNGVGSAKSTVNKKHIITASNVPLERFESLIHPSAWVSSAVTLGKGSVIAQNSVVMSGAVIGDHVKMLPNSVISYGSVIGDYCTVSSGAVTLAETHVGMSSYLGCNSSLIERVSVGDNCIVGMGAVVLKNVPDNSVVVGNPAKFLRNTI